MLGIHHEDRNTAALKPIPRPKSTSQNATKLKVKSDEKSEQPYDKTMLHTETRFLSAISATKQGGKPLLIFFTDPNHGVCIDLDPLYMKLIPKNPTIKMKKVDVTENIRAVQKADVGRVPAFKFYKNG